MTYQHALQYLAAHEDSSTPHLPLEALLRLIGKSTVAPLVVCTSHDKQGSATAHLLRSVLVRADVATLHLIDAPEYDARERYIIDGKPIAPTLLCAHAQDVRMQEIKLRRAVALQQPTDTEPTFPLPHRALAVLLRCLDTAHPHVILLEGGSETPYLRALCEMIARPTVITLVSATDERAVGALACILDVTREVISHPLGPALFRACSDACVRTASRLSIIAKTAHQRHSVTLGGQTLDYNAIKDCRLCSGSALSADAAVLAAEAAYALRRAGLAISNEAIKAGLSQAVLPTCTLPVSIHPLTVTEYANTPTELAYAMRDLNALSDMLPHPRRVLLDAHLASAFEPYAPFADTITYDAISDNEPDKGCAVVIGSADFIRQAAKIGAKK